ncbi:aminotransferase class I/II-fold pyridoxal phosphate-dependent enzyme [Polycladomyces subterraneus]|uniref:Aminotransferase class I/II-fold pyridoxal phosphate-dependent enzyme n=1 Tax=Polycladomyces subterraneus TaxID=1016997 RepID=A0ABT8IKX9_9BACL|nr:aminotransferase class I/II-fold pyridoxal phosphate-dependent enzyme [Polycladomyces subterraneus]MDN4593439.1 aminotransferase class I/II-fold pyridoxal phosphate-dependent enzyme [Polycladomyces subterraneus]
MLDHFRVPLYEALCSHCSHSRGNYHVPGHKQGRAFDEKGLRYFRSILEIDLTEVGELDDLHDAQGVIAEAQALAADAFGADRTFFLVGGTTAGILATILSICRHGDLLAVQRHSHQSVFHACRLAGVQPVYLGSCLDPDTDLDTGIDLRQLEEVLHRFPQIKGVVITSPSYFGVVQPVKTIAAICHEHGVPLVVDEAHGAHLTFSDRLPLSAMQAGADVAAQSTHKMLPAMTMSSMLHVQGDAIDLEDLVTWLRVIQSSSPSYPLMASLDLARRYMMTRGREELSRVIEAALRLRECVSNLAHLEPLSAACQDPLKLAIRARKRISGYRMLEWLERRGIYAELADHQSVLFVFTMGTRERDWTLLCETLRQLDQEIPDMAEESPWSVPDLRSWTLADGPLHELMGADKMSVPLHSAVGRISATMVVPYPPGIPLLLPGEPVTEEKVSYMERVVERGGKIRGLSGRFPLTLSVLQ